MLFCDTAETSYIMAKCDFGQEKIFGVSVCVFVDGHSFQDNQGNYLALCGESCIFHPLHNTTGGYRFQGTLTEHLEDSFTKLFAYSHIKACKKNT